MKISIFGTGYVGLVTGVCLASLGNEVICADIEVAKIQTLDRGATSIYEPGLQDLLERGKREGRITFTTDLTFAVQKSDLLFICVGTPSNKKGAAELKYVRSVAETIGAQLDKEKFIVIKSTVPVGTNEKVRSWIAAKSKKPFHVISNPEFLKEGAAVHDFFNPDRIIVGTDYEKSRKIMATLYSSVARTSRPIPYTDPRSAELIKYASNAMLATRISFMNQLSGYCEKVGADITAVSKGMGLDTRIGSRFLHAGVGYGGSCFPKDLRGLIASIREAGCDASLFEAVDTINERQKQSLFSKISALGSVKGKTVAIWGLSFKPKTDDIREAPSRGLVEWLLRQGAHVAAFDPEAMIHFKGEFPAVHYGETPYDVLQGADFLVLVTEWDEFRNPDWTMVKKHMRALHVIDGRNIWLDYREELARLGFSYAGVGVPQIP